VIKSPPPWIYRMPPVATNPKKITTVTSPKPW
jgi:hypothetical protein